MRSKKGCLGVVIGFGLVGLAVAVWADLDDRLFATARNDRLMAIVYTPHLTAGDTVVVKLILRTGTKSDIQRILAFHGQDKLSLRSSTGLFGMGYQRFAAVQLPSDMKPGDGTLQFRISFRPPRRNPVATFAKLSVPVNIQSAAGKQRSQLHSVALSLLSLVIAMALSVVVGRFLRRHPPEAQNEDNNDMAVWNIGCSLAMHGLLGYWLFAMPVAAATGWTDSLFFGVLIGAWLVLSVAVGWLAASKVAPRHVGGFDSIAILEPAEPTRQCSILQLQQLLTAAAPEVRIHEQARGLRFETDRDTVWVESPEETTLSLSTLRLTAKGDSSTLLLRVAHCLSQLLGPFTLQQGLTKSVRIDPGQPFEDLELASLQATMASIDTMTELLKPLLMPQAGQQEENSKRGKRLKLAESSGPGPDKPPSKESEK